MVEVSVPCHPLTRRILLAEYGVEPIRVDRNDTIFVILTAMRGERIPEHKATALLSAQVRIVVQDSTARSIERNRYTTGFALLKYHKELLHRYTHAAVLSGAKAWNTIEAFLRAYNVTEEEYGTDTAYKNWQRWGWFFNKKNSDFRIQRRRKTGAKVATLAPLRRGQISPFSNAQLDAIADRALEALQSTFTTLPPRLGTWLRHYIYIGVGGYSKRTAARVLGQNTHTVYRGYCQIRRRREASAAFHAIVEESIALPQ